MTFQQNLERSLGISREEGRTGKRRRGRRRREVAAPWRRSRSRRGMARRRLLGGMALLLLQALPSPLSVRAEPPQVRGRVVWRPEGPGWGPRGR